MSAAAEPAPAVVDPDPGTPAVESAGRYLLWLAGHARRPLLLAGLYGIVQMLGQALVPAAIGEAIERGVIARDQPALLRWAGAILILAVVQAVAGTLRDRSALAAALGAAYRTMQLVTRHASHLGAGLSGRASTGEVVAIGVVDIENIRGTFDIAAARGLGSAVAIAVVAAILLTTSWQLGLLVLVGVPLMAWAIALLIRPLHAHQSRLRGQQADLADRGGDVAGGLRVLRGVGGEEMFARAYRDESQRVRRAGVDVARVEALLDSAKVVLPGLLVAAVVWMGARHVRNGEIGVGQFVAFCGYAVFLSSPMRRVAFAVETLTRGVVAARSVTRFLSIAPPASGVDRGAGAGPEDGPALLVEPVSGLTARPGRMTAVVCASADEPARLADLLGGYGQSEARHGEIRLRDLPGDQLRRRVLVADNRAHLFSGVLRSEIDPLGRPDAGARVERALGAAVADDIVEALPDGLDQAIAGAGRELSGGQQQRLRLVRALLFEPEVLVLVDPTSSVDAHTERAIAQRLRAHRAGRSTIVFTTSPAFLDLADEIVLVEDGAVSRQGTHAALLADRGYRALVMREEGAAA